MRQLSWDENKGEEDKLHSQERKEVAIKVLRSVTDVWVLSAESTALS